MAPGCVVCLIPDKYNISQSTIMMHSKHASLDSLEIHDLSKVTLLCQQHTGFMFGLLWPRALLIDFLSHLSKKKKNNPMSPMILSSLSPFFFHLFFPACFFVVRLSVFPSTRFPSAFELCFSVFLIFCLSVLKLLYILLTFDARICRYSAAMQISSFK